jgi:hypothetical protein
MTLRRLLVAAIASTSIAASLAGIPGTASANYAGGTYYFDRGATLVSGPEWVGDLAAMDENVACAWFGGPPQYGQAGYWLNPCEGHVPSGVCAQVINANWEGETPWICGWEVESAWVNAYGWVVVGSWIPYEGRNIFILDNW